MGLFYEILPNYVYVKKQENKGYKVSKKIKDKTLVMEMVCNASCGHRFPITLIGRSKNPLCFELLLG